MTKDTKFIVRSIWSVNYHRTGIHGGLNIRVRPIYDDRPRISNIRIIYLTVHVIMMSHVMIIHGVTGLNVMANANKLEYVK